MRPSLEMRLRSREEAIYLRAGCRRNAKGQWDAFDADASLHRQAAVRIAELEAAIGSAQEWLERMRFAYFTEPDTTDREREKIDQLIEWLNNLQQK